METYKKVVNDEGEFLEVTRTQVILIPIAEIEKEKIKVENMLDIIKGLNP